MDCDLLDWKAAEAGFKKALDLNPSYATAHFWYSIQLTWMGRHEEAIEHARKAVELDPLSHGVSIVLGQALTYARLYDDAITHLERRLSAEPESRNMRFILGIAYVYNGLYDKAVAEQRKVIAVPGNSERPQAMLGVALARLGRESEAREVLAGLQKTHSQLGLLAMVQTELVERDGALESLEKAFREGEPGLGWRSVIPSFDALRSEPRFIDIMRGMNLA